VYQLQLLQLYLPQAMARWTGDGKKAKKKRIKRRADGQADGERSAGNTSTRTDGTRPKKAQERKTQANTRNIAGK
jgi:hypothetical protein